MVRKTKEDAELTRQRIIDATRTVFLACGVSRSTLEHIAPSHEAQYIGTLKIKLRFSMPLENKFYYP